METQVNGLEKILFMFFNKEAGHANEGVEMKYVPREKETINHNGNYYTVEKIYHFIDTPCINVHCRRN